MLIDDEETRRAIARFADEGSHSASTLRLLEVSDFPSISREMVRRILAALEAKILITTQRWSAPRSNRQATARGQVTGAGQAVHD